MISGKVFYGGANNIMVDKEDNTNKKCDCDSCIECNCDPSVCRCGCHTEEDEQYEGCSTLF